MELSRQDVSVGCNDAFHYSIVKGTLQKMKPGTKQPPMSLRQSQVTLLLREMAHSAGVKVDIRHKDAHRGIALVNFMDQVWMQRLQLRKNHETYLGVIGT